MYLLLKDHICIPSNNIDLLYKIADEINGIIIEPYGPKSTDFNIIYVGGESKILANVK